ncbi:hypothetical protein [Rhizorhabdus argentea]|uniref:hypothetical protein n=1 Tax=Rhizorhabdus argentea TaxID=1387174 RepID=UPI0030EF4195
MTVLAASLPHSFRLGRQRADNAAAVWLAGGAGSWASRAAQRVRDEAGWTVVIDPGPDEPDHILALADQVGEAGARIALSEPFAGNPILPHFKEQLPPAIRVCNMHARTEGSLVHAVFAQLRLARILGFRDLAVRDVCAVPGGAMLTLSGEFDNAEMTLRALASTSDALSARLDVKARGADAAAELTLFGTGTARPAIAFVVDEKGRQQLPTIYETAHRSVLRGLPTRALMTADDLSELAADIALVRALALT